MDAPRASLLLCLALAACSTAAPSGGSTPPATISAAPVATLAPPVRSGLPAAEPPASGAAASAAPEGPVPNVKVANIGMHIGGGPNDAATKLPIKQSVEPYFDDLKRCFTKVEDQKKGGDFGLDLLIDKAGGKAKTSHARTTMKGAGFVECMVAAFDAIDFKKPKGGTTMVSYSVRFTP